MKILKRDLRPREETPPATMQKQLTKTIHGAPTIQDTPNRNQLYNFDSYKPCDYILRPFQLLLYISDIPENNRTDQPSESLL